MAYEDVDDRAGPAEGGAAAAGSLLGGLLAAASLVRAAEHHIARALPRRMADDKLAAALGVTPDGLQAAFARVKGESTYRSLLKMRVKLVDLTLRGRPDLSPRAVAKVCGFGYFGRFHQLYRRDTGRSPEIPTARVRTSPEALDRAREAVAATVERVFGSLAEGEAAASTGLIAACETRAAGADAPGAPTGRPLTESGRS